MNRSLLVALCVCGALTLGAPAGAVRERALHADVSVSKNGGGRVTSSPPGIDCGTDCVENFPSEDNTAIYQPVQLTATPDPGWEFEGWSGDCSGTGGCTLELKRLENKSVTATFKLVPQPNYQVAVGRIGSGTVTSTPAGIDCGSTCSASFDTGSSVALSATPAPGWTFTGWSGDCGGAGACNFTVNGPKSVTAIFSAPPPDTHPIGVNRSGDGTVNSNPPGIDCGSACGASYAAGTQVTLTATPAPGASFSGWGGDCGAAGAGPTCTVTMDGPKTVTANFGQAPPPTLPVAVSKSGNGTVTSSPAGLDCGATCSASFARGASVALTAAPAAGWRFAGWSGACTGTEATCTLTMDAPKSVTAAFAELPTSYPLAVATQGNGTVTSVPAGIACGATCSASFSVGAAVTLRAAAAARWQFSGWSGACSGRAAVCTVTVDAPKSAAASFARRADQTAPRVRALASTGQRGRPVRLRYRVSDNSGRSREWAHVYRGNRRLATVRSPLDAAEAGVLFYFMNWRVPQALDRGLLRFCVHAADAAGNKSKPSCARLRIR